MNISQYIVKARRRLGLSQKGLAEALGVSQGSVSKWEAGKESPRAETVERIKELSGVKYPEAENERGEEEDFSTFCEVAYQGSFTDSYPYAPFNVDDAKTIMIYLKKSLAAQPLEAWAVNGMYPNLPRSFIGIFKLLNDIERAELQGHPGRNSRVLTRSTRHDGTVSFSIEEVNGDDRMGYWLWPLDRRARSRTLPMKIKASDGQEKEGTTIPYGVLVAVLYEPSQYPPRSNF